MDIKFNNQLYNVNENCTLDIFLKENSNLRKWDVVLLNGSPVEKNRYNIKLNNKDEIAIVSFFGGG